MLNVDIENDEVEEGFKAVGELMSQLETRTLSLLGIKEQLNHLMGDVLTIMDASLVDPIQRKAVKDLVKQKFYAKEHWIYEFVDRESVNCEQVTGSPWVVEIKK